MLGFHAQEILGRVEFGRAEPVVCENWADGQSASLRCGLAALRRREQVIVTLGDQPRMTPRVIALFLDQPAGDAGGVRGTARAIRSCSDPMRCGGDGSGRRRGCPDLLGGGPVIEWVTYARAATSTPPRTWRHSAMKLEQSFEVAAPLERVWAALIDVEHVAPCLPGAAVTGRNDDGSYNGTFKVKIGPTSASYRGKLEMENVDEAAHTRDDEGPGHRQARAGGAKATIVSTVTAGPPGDHGRGRHRLSHHRSPGPVRARRDDRGHLRAAARAVRGLVAGFAGRRWRRRSGAGRGRERPAPERQARGAGRRAQVRRPQAGGVTATSEPAPGSDRRSGATRPPQERRARRQRPGPVSGRPPGAPRPPGMTRPPARHRRPTRHTPRGALRWRASRSRVFRWWPRCSSARPGATRPRSPLW